jgi:hypothetical protein
MTNDRESIRLTLAELWAAELLAIVEAAATGLETRSAVTRILARIDALETPPERPDPRKARMMLAAPENGVEPREGK